MYTHVCVIAAHAAAACMRVHTSFFELVAARYCITYKGNEYKPSTLSWYISFDAEICQDSLHKTQTEVLKEISMQHNNN